VDSWNKRFQNDENDDEIDENNSANGYNSSG
jgi:hypothetical protein